MLGRSSALVLPALLFLLGLFVLPLVLLAAIGVFPVRGTTIVWERPDLAPYLRYVTDPFYLRVTVRTLGMAAAVTLTCLALGFPYAYAFTRVRPAWKTLLLLVVVSPILTGTVVRSYGWLVILGRRGLLNDLLLSAGVIGAPLRLSFTMQGVVIALTQVMLPFMVLPVISVLARQNPSLYDAAAGAGAPRALAGPHALLPPTPPGTSGRSGPVLQLALSAFTPPPPCGRGRFTLCPPP